MAAESGAIAGDVWPRAPASGRSVRSLALAATRRLWGYDSIWTAGVGSSAGGGHRSRLRRGRKAADEAAGDLSAPLRGSAGGELDRGRGQEGERARRHA